MKAMLRTVLAVMLLGHPVLAFGEPAALAPVPAAMAAKPQPIRLVRVVVKLADGEVWATEGMTGLCGMTVYKLQWDASHSELRPERAAAIFKGELEKAGLSDTSGASLFEDTPANEFQVAVSVTAMKARLCGFEDDEGNRSVAGTMTMSTEWQIYDPLRREVIAKVQTTASGEEKERHLDGPDRVFVAALRANAKALMSDTAFREAVLQSPRPPAAGPAAGRLDPILLVRSPGPIKIADAVGSVVTVFTGQAFGSAVLVSADGYMLTNQHVVSDAKTVRVKWSDGFEAPAEVIRSDKARDVALIKTEPRGRSALQLNPATPPPGTTVFAVGTPIDPKLQSTVTRGVVSGDRIINGFRFIQSDAPVTHGNSGGPLLNEKGEVIGLTDWGLPVEGSLLNFFIPIGDALDFLALKPAG
jgi:S1-C subfamily serine protease